MDKKLITLLGVLVSVGVVVLAVIVGAMPFVGSGFAALGQTAQVAATNQTYQVEVQRLQDEEQRMPEIEASVAALRTQITTSPRLDDIFELVSAAAGSAGVRVVSVSAGDPAAFLARTGTGEALPVPPVADTAPTEDAAAETTAAETTTLAAAGDRAQVAFVISVTATEMDAVRVFLDALRSDGRLLGIDRATARPDNGGISVQIDAFAFVAASAEGEAAR